MPGPKAQALTINNMQNNYPITTQGFQIKDQQHESELREYANSLYDFLKTKVNEELKSLDYLHILSHKDYTVWGFAFTLNPVNTICTSQEYKQFAQEFLEQDGSWYGNYATAFVMDELDEPTLYIHLYVCC